MNENCKLIWTSEVDVDDWDGYFLEVNPNLDRDERYVAAAEINQSYLDDERTNLNIVLKHPIIAIADMGLWYGRRPGYRIIESGNIADCLQSTTDVVCWYVDEHNEFCSDQCHHDGTNYVVYRELKELDEEEVDKLIDLICRGKCTEEILDKYTSKIGDRISAVYGWEQIEEAV